MKQYLFTIILTASITFALTWAVWRLSMKFKLYPGIRERDVHKTPKPRLGGVAMFIGIAVAILISTANPFFERMWSPPQTLWAILAAAGSGERLGADRPKAFVALGELPLLAASMERLDESEWIDAIVVAAPPGWEEPSILLAEELGAGKVSAVVAGGATRAESVRLALAEVPVLVVK